MFVLFGWAAASAQDVDHIPHPLPDPLPRDAFVALVLQSHPSMVSARLAVRAARDAHDVAGAPADPHLAWSVAPLTASTGRLGQTLEVSQEVGVGGRRAYERAMAGADADATEHDLARVRSDLALEAGLAWERWWSVDARIALRRTHEAVVQDLASIVQDRAGKGLSTRVEVLEARSELASLRVDLAELTAERETVRIALDQLLALPPNAPVPPAADPADTPAPEPADPAWNRPELGVAQSRLDASVAGGRVARAARVPDVELMASESTMWDTTREGWMVGIGSDVPLFQRARRAAVDQAEALAAQATADLQVEEGRVDAEIAAAHAEFERADGVARLRRDELVPLARERLDTARISLGSGEVGTEDLLRAERDLLDAEEELVDAESARRAALLTWRHAAGAPPTETAP